MIFCIKYSIYAYVSPPYGAICLLHDFSINSGIWVLIRISFFASVTTKTKSKPISVTFRSVKNKVWRYFCIFQIAPGHDVEENVKLAKVERLHESKERPNTRIAIIHIELSSKFMLFVENFKVSSRSTGKIMSVKNLVRGKLARDNYALEVVQT